MKRFLLTMLLVGLASVGFAQETIIRKVKFDSIAVNKDFSENSRQLNQARLANNPSCQLNISTISPAGNVIGEPGDPVFNLGLSHSFVDNSRAVFYEYTSSEFVVAPDPNQYFDLSKCYENWALQPETQRVSFSVTTPGQYKITIKVPEDNNLPNPFSIFSVAQPNCNSLVGSNSKWEKVDNEAKLRFTNSVTVTLAQDKEYFLIFYNLYGEPVYYNLEFEAIGHNGNLNFHQVYPGKYTYIAFDQSDGKAVALSSTSNFTSLDAGNYKVYGMHYDTGIINLNPLIGKTFNEVIQYSYCKVMSDNYVELQIGSEPEFNGCILNIFSIFPDEEISGVSGDPEFNLDLDYTIDGRFGINSILYNPTRTEFATGSILEPGNDCLTSVSWGVYDVQLMPIKVDESGAYEFSIYRTESENLYFPFSIFNDYMNLDCEDLIGSNTYWSFDDFYENYEDYYEDYYNGYFDENTQFDFIGATHGWKIDLEKDTQYYLAGYFWGSSTYFNLSVSGPGSVDGMGIPIMNFTYIAVDVSDNKVKLVSSSSDFTSLEEGEYKIYGVNYDDSYDPDDLLGEDIDNSPEFQGCIMLSSNSIKLEINSSNEDPCPPTQNLTGLADSGTIKASKTISSTQVIESGKNVEYQAAKSIVLTPQTGSGFEVKPGGVFKAEIRNCD